MDDHIIHWSKVKELNRVLSKESFRLIVLGPDGAGKKTAVKTAARNLGLDLREVDGNELDNDFLYHKGRLSSAEIKEEFVGFFVNTYNTNLVRINTVFLFKVERMFNIIYVIAFYRIYRRYY